MFVALRWWFISRYCPPSPRISPGSYDISSSRATSERATDWQTHVIWSYLTVSHCQEGDQVLLILLLLRLLLRLQLVGSHNVFWLDLHCGENFHSGENRHMGEALGVLYIRGQKLCGYKDDVIIYCTFLLFDQAFNRRSSYLYRNTESKGSSGTTICAFLSFLRFCEFFLSSYAIPFAFLSMARVAFGEM